jgi:hypothetical protein
MRIRKALFFMLLAGSLCPSQASGQTSVGGQLPLGTATGGGIGIRALREVLTSAEVCLSLDAFDAQDQWAITHWELTAGLLYHSYQFLKPPLGSGRGNVAWYVGLGVQLARGGDMGWETGNTRTTIAALVGGTLHPVGKKWNPFIEVRFIPKEYNTFVLSVGVLFNPQP